ncbi:MAG: hypothetical protein JWO86_3126 [Myxococcaceae bacterium]|nr:hypothetical protein [Myxococcaceae bacterium]MEA2748085.1 hypothetical protein [Myxococcales bacterium]
MRKEDERRKVLADDVDIRWPPADELQKGFEDLEGDFVAASLWCVKHQNVGTLTAKPFVEMSASFGGGYSPRPGERLRIEVRRACWKGDALKTFFDPFRVAVA